MKKVSLKEFQEILLHKFIKINNEFRKNNITWWAHAGTLLGFIRHQGMIPWDDDIDMAMTYKEFFKNKTKIYEIAEKHNLVFTDNTTSLNGSSTLNFTFKEKFLIEWKGQEFKHTPFFDIMVALPFFMKSSFINSLWTIPWKIYQNKKELKKFKQSKKYVNIMIPGKIIQVKKWIAFLYIFPFYFIPYRTISKFVQKKYDNAYKSKGNNDWNKVQLWMGDKRYWTFETSNFIDYKVNDKITVKCSKNWKQELEAYFGKNYMSLPPKHQQIPHHLFMDKIKK